MIDDNNNHKIIPPRTIDPRYAIPAPSLNINPYVNVAKYKFSIAKYVIPTPGDNINDPNIHDCAAPISISNLLPNTDARASAITATANIQLQYDTKFVYD